MTVWTIADVRAALADGPDAFAGMFEEVIGHVMSMDRRIGAWVEFSADYVRGQAKAAETLRAGPLGGVPVGIKDIIDVAGLPTRADDQGAFREAPVSEDAGVTAALRRAGAVVMGKTCSTEYAWFAPTETRNPRITDYSPGGSSSGSAAAVASGMCPVALGTQTAGSLMRPAAFCGVVAIKPTHGTVSLAGVVPVSPSLDVVGVFANRVADAAAVTEIIGFGSGSRPRAPHHTGQLRLGMLRDFFWTEASPESLEASEEALARLRSAGADVTDVRLPESFATSHGHHRTIMLVEMAFHRQERYYASAETLSPALRDDIETGMTISETTYREARHGQRRLLRDLGRLSDGFDALVTPGSKTLAPLFGDTGDPAFHQPFSLAGLPTVLIPTGWSEPGTPTGLQLVGRWGGDADLVDVAQRCEKIFDFDYRRAAAERQTT